VAGLRWLGWLPKVEHEAVMIPRPRAASDVDSAAPVGADAGR
jgi:hypothetical protein